MSILDGMTTQPLAAGIDRKALIAQTIIELDDPGSISQRNKNTCGATVVQIALTHDNHAEYARLVSGLATPSGTTTMANGATIKRAGDWQAADGGRSIPSALLQPALMNVAAAPFAYDNTTDKIGDQTGLIAEQEAQLLGATFGGHAEILKTKENGGSMTDDQVLAKSKVAADSGKNASPLVIYPGVGGHYVLVTKVYPDKVVYQNPWGQVESMPIAQFKDILHGGAVGNR